MLLLYSPPQTHLSPHTFNTRRVYTKPKGKLPDFNEPVVLPRSQATIEGFCNKIHKTLLKQLKYANVWGSSVKHRPQKVGKEHALQDEDIVQVRVCVYGVWGGGWMDAGSTPMDTTRLRHSGMRVSGHQLLQVVLGDRLTRLRRCSGLGVINHVYVYATCLTSCVLLCLSAVLQIVKRI